jgi:hypothetical protein
MEEVESCFVFVGRNKVRGVGVVLLELGLEVSWVVEHFLLKAMLLHELRQTWLKLIKTRFA